MGNVLKFNNETMTLTGWFQTLRKKKEVLVSWDDSSQYMEKQKSCKPPTLYDII